jgi:hypothetical protein
MTKNLFFDMPKNGVHADKLKEQIIAIAPSALVSFLGSIKKVRVIVADADLEKEIAIDEAIKIHDPSTALAFAIEEKNAEIDIYSEKIIHSRFDYNGSNFNGDFVSQFRILAKLQDAVEYNKNKTESEPEFQMTWIARPQPVNLTESDFQNMKYLLEARVTEEVFRGAAAKANMAASCSTVDEIIKWNIEGKY